MTWDSTRKRQFREALQYVYRSYNRLQIFVSDTLGLNLEAIAGRGDLETTTFKLVDWLDAEFQIDLFYAAFSQANPHHPFAGRGTGRSPVTSSGSSGSFGSEQTIDTQGGDYRETNVRDRVQYAEGSIDNRRDQKGIIANDGSTIHIGTVVYNSTDSDREAPAETTNTAPSEPELIETPYISRRSIEGVSRIALTQPGSLIRIKAPHRFGKTELISQLCTLAESKGYQIVTIDLSRAETRSLESLDRFLRWFCKRIARRLKIHEPIDEYWDDELGSNTSCSDYISEAILDHLDEPLVLALDNVDALFEHQPIVLEFFKLLRSWYEAARREPVWQKLRLILAHATEPYEFLKVADSHHSPFNVGEAIELPAFDRQQVSELVAQFGLTARVDLAQLYALLDGHPELLQIGLKFLRLDSRRSLTDLAAEARKCVGEFSSHLNGL